MSRARKLLRLLLVWWLPGLAMLAAGCAAFLAWLGGSQAGTALLLRTVAEQMNGRAEAVQGSLWQGVRVGGLSLVVPGTATIEARDLALQVDWRALSDRLLRVRELSAASLSVELSDLGTPPEDTADAQADAGPPGLPVRVAVDRLALGRLDVARGGQPLPVVVEGLDSTLAAGEGVQWRIRAIEIGHALARARLQGELGLERLAAPWPMRVQLAAELQGTGPDSPLCAGLARVPGGRPGAPAGKPGASSVEAGRAAADAGPWDPAAAQCVLALDAQVSGSLDELAVALDGRGRDAQLRARAELAPSAAFPVRRAEADLRLADGSGLRARVDRLRAGSGASGAGLEQITGALAVERLDLGQLLGGTLPPAVLTADMDLDLRLAGEPDGADGVHGEDAAGRADRAGAADADGTDRAGGAGEAAGKAGWAELLRAADVNLKLGEGSRWNGQPLAGTLQARVEGPGPGAAPGGPAAQPAAARPRDAAQGPGDSPAAASPPAVPAWTRLRLARLDTDLRLGAARVRTQGGWGAAADALSLDIAAPRLAAFWPGLPGGAAAKGRLSGGAQAHRAELEASYTPDGARQGVIGKAPMTLRTALAGGWGTGAQGAFQAGMAGWRGRIERLQAEHAGLRAALVQALPAAFLPGAAAPAWQWQAGAAALEIALPGTGPTRIEHAGSRGGAGRWETRGRLDNLVVTPSLVRGLRDAFDPQDPSQRTRPPARVNPVSDRDRRIALDASWDLKFAGALSGRARIERRDGDLRIPGDPPVPLGLERLALDVKATALSAAASRLDATLDLATAKMGTLHGAGSAVLSSAGGGFALDRRQPMNGTLDADIRDLAWVGLFVGDTMEVGGRLRAQLRGSGTLGGDWRASGTVEGEQLRFVRIDDGVRLVDGTLAARLDGERFVLESLRFPASLRVVPTEWRTREWITQNPDAQNGEIRASGEWNLLSQAGAVHVALRRFPVLQRADRYAMVSGGIDIRAEMPAIDITGELKADAGWASLEILSGVPTLDDDVIVVRRDQEVETPSATRLSMVMKIDLGPRFYLTGMGLDSGLVGAMEIRLADGRLSGVGALRTRGGRFEAYGQKLHLRRGTITFQESLDNPLLDIEALRLGEQVEAGVRVGGTARRPRIDLVSYPDVADVEKISWLVLGRGPDESGNDAALLLSVGAALLGDGEPFYRQFGLDDVSIRSGAIGSSGSLLPDTTVASNVFRSSGSDLENQFLVASKRIAEGVTFSVEQGLSGSETVGRLSYQLSRRLSADLKGGGVNGIELVYRMLLGD